MVAIGIQEAVTNMLGEEDGSGEHCVEDTAARRGSAVQLETVDEGDEDTLEVIDCPNPRAENGRVWMCGYCCVLSGDELRGRSPLPVCFGYMLLALEVLRDWMMRW